MKLDGSYNLDLGTRRGEHTLSEKALERFADLLSRRWYVVVSVWLCVVAVSMVGYSKQKPLWADEVVYRWIAMLPTVRATWQALTLGLNPDPPFAHLMTHGLVMLFGSSPVIVRLPSIGGILVMVVCLYSTLREYTGPIYALLGLFVPFCTTLVDYGYEARPYGLMYGCFGIAVYCWAKAGQDRSHRVMWNTGLGVGLSAALSCHFWAVFALPAFYLGEIARIIRRHRVNWSTLSVLVGSSATVLLYWPIIAGGLKYSTAYFATPQLMSVPLMIEDSLRDIGLPLFSVLFLMAILIASGAPLPQESREEEIPYLREITALGLGFLLVPILGWLAGMILKAFTDRYVLHGLLGVFLLFPLFACKAFKSRQSIGMVLVVGCGLPALLYVALGTAKALKTPNPLVAAANGGARQSDLSDLELALPRFNGDIVVSDPHVFLQIVNYSPVLKARCIYLWDAEKERKYAGHDDFYNFVRNGVPLGWYRAESWNSYRSHDEAFLFLTTPDGQSDGAGWLRAYLASVERYGVVTTKIGQYLLVAAKPQKD